MALSDKITKAADQHLRNRLHAREAESSIASSRDVNKDGQSVLNKTTAFMMREDREANEAREQLFALEEEEKHQEAELEKHLVQLQLMKQQTEEARKIASLRDRSNNN